MVVVTEVPLALGRVEVRMLRREALSVS